jgi:2-hydroxychromene-2-carboxylate isomerase
VTHAFALTYDYRCPYARIAHDHVLTALRDGADWDVTFLPFSLGQVHVAEGEPPVWERPEDDSGLLALQASIATRDAQPDHFLAVHQALFDHRHSAGGQLRTRDDLTPVLAATAVDVERLWTEVDSGRPLATVEKEHTAFAESHNVWGVPTFILGDAAVFVRLMHVPDGDGAAARATIERVLDQIRWPILNEFKHTSIPR